ncbi:MAG: tRNA pseudouridine(55) synthase TruB [Hyphomicrobiales bacterium]
MPKNKNSNIDGWFILDKPVNISSAKAVNAVKKCFNIKKAGHAGTLDPLASGVLPIAINSATKTIPYLVNTVKTYRFIIKWGEQTDTDDSEGEIIKKSDHRPIEKSIKKILKFFIGKIEQTPPRFSALKINGERAYKLARNKEEFEIKSRTVNVQDLKLLKYINSELAEFEITCEKGFYIRSLARDISLKLDTVGHVYSLKRTKVGQFYIKDAFPLETLEKLVHSAPAGRMAKDFLLPLDCVLDDIPALHISDEEAKMFCHGQAINKKISSDYIPNGSDVLVKNRERSLGIAVFFEESLKPKRVFSNFIN